MAPETVEKFDNEVADCDDQKSNNREAATDEETQLEKIPYPKSVFFIISNEFCERFSYYGMRTVLSLYLRDILLYSEKDATVIYHTFSMLAYFFPIVGAIISDNWLGKFRTILYVSIIYASGNVLLALSSAKPTGIPQGPFSLVALLLIAVGTGGIKPCVSAFGGDQFVLPQQELQLAAFFSVFYFSINAGSLISTFLTPVLREDIQCFGEDSCYPLAFVVPGILMVVSIIIFFSGTPLYKIKKPEGNVIVQVFKCIGYGAKRRFASKEKHQHWLDHAEDKYKRSLIEDIKTTLKVLVVFTPLPIFWALYDQQGSRWTFQATRMDGQLGSWTLLPDQMQVLNPFLILVFIPLFTYVVYPFLGKFGVLKTPLQRMVCGGFLAALAFGVSAGVSAALEATDPDLPTEGFCHLRIYNPHECGAVFTLDQQEIEIKEMGYEFIRREFTGQHNFSYQFTSSCVGDGNYTGTFSLRDATGYVFYPSDKGFITVPDDISKPDDGFPRIRTLVDKPSDDYELRYRDGDRTALSILSSDCSLQSIHPGTYSLGNASAEFKLGGVYTVLAELTQDGAPRDVAVYEITEPNSIHILLLVPQYVIITVAEILFSITGLEFSYSQAPATMKSVLTAAFLLTSAVGDLIIVIVESSKIFEKQSYDFLLYAGLMVLDMIIFGFIAKHYVYVKKSDGDANNVRNTDNRLLENEDSF